MTTQSAPAPVLEDVAAATPAQIDYHLARLDNQRHGLLRRLNALRDASATLRLGTPAWGLPWHATPHQIAEHSAKVAGEIAAAETKLVEVAFLSHPLETAYDERGGWRRYYLVEDGHLHYDVSGSRCSRVHSTTHYWMTEFSGQEPAEVIAQAGERVCTTCFPEAPVNPRPATARFMTLTEAERAAYAEEKARKAAAKKAAQITTPDGQELRTAGGYHGDLIKTEVAARRRALADASDIAFYGASDPSAAEWRETVDRMIAALAHRTGMDEGTLRAEINGKVAKKARREGWTVKATI